MYCGYCKTVINIPMIRLNESTKAGFIQAVCPNPSCHAAFRFEVTTLRLPGMIQPSSKPAESL